MLKLNALSWCISSTAQVQHLKRKMDTQPNKQSRRLVLLFTALWRTFFKRLLFDKHIDILRGAIKRRERMEFAQFVRISGESPLY